MDITQNIASINDAVNGVVWGVPALILLIGPGVLMTRGLVSRRQNARPLPERDLWFARRLIERLADYGVALEGGPELLAQRLPVNSEIYKHRSEQDLRELPSAEIWSRYFLR